MSEEEKVVNGGYEASSITVLEGLESCPYASCDVYWRYRGSRLTPSCLQEVVDNSIDEALAGYCKILRSLSMKTIRLL